MTQPSKVMAAVCATLQQKLGGKIPVRPISGQFGADLTDLNSLVAPGVYVAMLRMPTSQDYDPPTIDARFMALAIARDPRPDDGEKTRDDVALNLAAAVQSIVARTRFPDAQNQPVMMSAASNIAATNSFDPRFARKGFAAWRVEWTQTFEITPRDVDDTLVKLREIRITALVGDGNTPDVSANVVMEEEGP